jgi:hypothetical protein
MNHAATTPRSHQTSFFSAPLRLAVLAVMLLAAPAHAATFKRSLEVIWDETRAQGHEMAYVEFQTAGQHQEDGSDIRVMREGGQPVPFRVLMIGPGDRASVLFALQKGERKYAVFFGDTSRLPPPRPLDEKTGTRGGLLMEMRPFRTGHLDNFKDIEAAWERAQDAPVIGRTIVEKPFLGFNPFGDQQQTISRFTGSLFVPMDGEYTFAGAADDRGGLWIDGKPVLFIGGIVGDIRFNAKAKLTRGWHDIVFYHINGGGEGRFSLAWKRPDQAAFEVIGRESLGIVPRAKVGTLEEIGKTLTADFTAEYLGESFFNNHYSHRIRFTVNQPKASANFTPEWDFGDGQKSNQRVVEHVFLTGGVYPIRLTLRIGSNSDTKTYQYLVRRDLTRIDNPPLDDVRIHSKIVAGYDVRTMPLSYLAWALTAHARAGDLDAFIEVAKRTMPEPRLPDVDATMRAMVEGTRAAILAGKGEEILAAWAATPEESNLQPRAARNYAHFLVWWMGDFKKAVEMLEPLAALERDNAGEVVENDPGLRDATRLRRIYAQALILNQQAEEGKAVLRSLTPDSHPERQVVISGALARSIEHYIDEGDWESGDDFWERWQTRYPATFIDGYSALLKVKLIEVRKQPAVAAKVAEAFATAIPDSSYAPQLLHYAAKLLEKTDPKKSEELLATLKKRYPEDPLAQ